MIKKTELKWILSDGRIVTGSYAFVKNPYDPKMTGLKITFEGHTVIIWHDGEIHKLNKEQTIIIESNGFIKVEETEDRSK